MTLREKIDLLRKSVAEAARRAGRSPDEISIVLVTKTVATEKIREAFQAGSLDFAENRVQELSLKKKELSGVPIRWHMIGHLQTNKVKQIVGEVDLIHSLDRPELAAEIERQAGIRRVNRVPVLIQVKVAEEESKSGFAPDAVADFVVSIRKDSPLEIHGLMAIAPLTAEQSSQMANKEAQIRGAFRATRELRDDLARRFPEKSWDILSMGMSGDYKIAIEEGSTLIRIGTAVFGMRGSK